MTIGTIIKKHRVSQNKSQQELSDFLGVDRNTYAKWENGTTEIKSSYIPKIAEYLDVSIQELFEPRKEMMKVIQKNKSCNNSINAAVLILTDKEMIQEVLNVINTKISK